MLGPATVTALLMGCMPPAPPGGPGAAEPPIDPSALAPKAFSPNGVPRLDGFSAAVRANGMVFLSLQLPPPEPPAPASRELLLQQADVVFSNLSKAALVAGAFPADLVRVTLYTRGMGDADLGAVRQALVRWFPSEAPPAVSIVIVPDLPVEGALLAADGVVAMRLKAKR